jgi:hypothetical protein
MSTVASHRIPISETKPDKLFQLRCVLRSDTITTRVSTQQTDHDRRDTGPVSDMMMESCGGSIVNIEYWLNKLPDASGILERWHLKRYSSANGRTVLARTAPALNGVSRTDHGSADASRLVIGHLSTSCALFRSPRGRGDERSVHGSRSLNTCIASFDLNQSSDATPVPFPTCMAETHDRPISRAT